MSSRAASCLLHAFFWQSNVCLPSCLLLTSAKRWRGVLWQCTESPATKRTPLPIFYIFRYMPGVCVSCSTSGPSEHMRTCFHLFCLIFTAKLIYIQCNFYTFYVCPSFYCNPTVLFNCCSKYSEINLTLFYSGLL